VKPRPADAAEVARLLGCLRDLHGVQGRHVGSVHVHETFRGQTAWEGDVEVFDVQGHPQTTRGYAWPHETDVGGRRYVAVLEIPPVTSAETAVRAAIVKEARARRTGN